MKKERDNIERLKVRDKIDKMFEKADASAARIKETQELIDGLFYGGSLDDRRSKDATTNPRQDTALIDASIVSSMISGQKVAAAAKNKHVSGQSVDLNLGGNRGADFGTTREDILKRLPLAVDQIAAGPVEQSADVEEPIIREV